MKRVLSASVLICCCILPVLSQAQSTEEMFYDAIFFYEDEEDYEEAAYIFRQVLEQEPENSNVKFLLGMCYNNIQGLEELGIPYFREAVEDITLKYKANRYSEKQAPHHAWFYMAEAFRKTNQMDASLDALNQFQSIRNFDKHYNVSITEAEIAAVERAKIIRDAELNLRTLYFNEPINTTDNDYNGVISASGKMMVWVNSRTFYEAVYMALREGDSWGQPILITPQIMSDGDLFPTGLSSDGTTLLLVKDSRRGDSDIWYSRYDGLIWSPAQPLHGEINSNSDEVHASFSPEGERIYLTSDRRGGEGGLDIWYSDKQPDGQWGKPVNMGDVINTDRDETSAYVSPDGSRFIFASQGHFNMGGFDIFRCEQEDDGRTWSQPSNIGFPINTTGDNTFYVPLNDGLSGLYSRFTNEGVGMTDLWYVEIVKEDGSGAGGVSILDEPSGLSFKDFALIVVDDETGEEIEILYDAETDTFRALASQNKTYRIISYKQK